MCMYIYIYIDVLEMRVELVNSCQLLMDWRMFMPHNSDLFPKVRKKGNCEESHLTAEFPVHINGVYPTCREMRLCSRIFFVPIV